MARARRTPPAERDSKGGDRPGRARRGWSALASALGANPLQLLVLGASFAISGYAFYRASLGALPERMAVWFVAAIVGHDLVLYPLYALADRSWHLASREVRRRVRGAEHTPAIPAVNYLRVPVIFSGLLLIVFYPSISGGGSGSLEAAAGHNDNPFLGRWLLITAVLFGISALAYAWRLGAVRHASRASGNPAPTRSAT